MAERPPTDEPRSDGLDGLRLMLAGLIDHELDENPHGLPYYNEEGVCLGSSVADGVVAALVSGGYIPVAAVVSSRTPTGQDPERSDEMDMANDALYPHERGCRALYEARIGEDLCRCSRRHFLLLTAEVRRLREALDRAYEEGSRDARSHG